MDIVHDPSFPETTASASSQRVCQSCYEEVTVSVPSRFRESRMSSMERIFIDQGRLSVPTTHTDSSSQLSDLAESVLNTFLTQNVAYLLTNGVGTVALYVAKY